MTIEVIFRLFISFGSWVGVWKEFLCAGDWEYEGIRSGKIADTGNCRENRRGYPEQAKETRDLPIKKGLKDHYMDVS